MGRGENVCNLPKGLLVLALSLLLAAPAYALSGREYMQLDSHNRSLHVMCMVEAMKYADDLSGRKL